MPLPGIQDPALLRQLRDSFGLQTPGEFALDQIVSPVAIVRDLRAGPEETRYSRRIITGAGSPLQFVQHLLRNPAGSGVLLRLIAWSVQRVTAEVRWIAAVTDPGTAGDPGFRLDSSFELDSRGVLAGRYVTAIPGAESIWAEQATGGGSTVPPEGPALKSAEWRPERLIIAPGTALLATVTVAESGARVGVEWAEIPAAR